MSNLANWRLSHLDKLYSRIPDCTVCYQGCGGQCCETPFAVSPFEKSLLPGNNFDTPGTCVFLQEGRCSVYEARPFICRIYGTCGVLSCKKQSGEPNRQMTDVEAIELWNDYITLFWDVESLKKTTIAGAMDVFLALKRNSQ